MKKNLMIIDGSSLLYRAFYAMPPLSDSQGRPTNAVYGFLNMLLKLYADLDPYYVAVAFDKDKHTFRTNYMPIIRRRENRLPMNCDLSLHSFGRFWHV